jgi:uncharacterized protein (TIGR03437 family)
MKSCPNGIKKAAVLTVLLGAWAVTPASAYYHFVHYLKTGNAPEKFDLTTLPGSAVTFLVSENGPTVYSNTDTWNSVLAAIQQATQAWNGVSSSALRVAFGGLESASTPQNTAGGDVIFEDLPPGVEGFGGPTSLATSVTAADGSTFFPIVRSVVHLSLNLTPPPSGPGPSYSQGFLMTTLHEMGHALGLQHTFASATMSQNTTRATTLTHPLDNDDVAGISVLYPNANFKQFGSITGNIAAGGNGVHMASVVAIAPGTGAIGAVTNPDGSYRIDGVPAGMYSVYVHTMPPDANVLGPWDVNGNAVAASGPVNTLFYPATTDVTQASPVAVTAGTITSGINIATNSRADVPFYDGQIFAYLNNNTLAVTPGPVDTASLVGFNALDAAGLGVQFLQIPGEAVSLAPNPYTPTGILPAPYNGYEYVDLYLGFNISAQPFRQPSPQHVIFNTPSYTYVLPSAMYLTQTGPPTVTAAAVNPDGSVSVSGTNLSSQTLVYFDSVPAAIQSFNPVAGVAVVTPPAGTNGQQSTVTVYNPDGQNSQMVQASSPVTYPYGTLATPVIGALSPSSLPAGAEAMIDITGSNLSFAQGSTTVGFGTSDVLVRRVFVLSPNHLQVDVSVSPGAALSSPDVTVLTGFQLATAPAALQITAAVANFPAVVPVLVNPYAPWGVTSVYPGAIVMVFGANLAPPFAGTPTITLGGLPATLTFWSPAQINLQIPPGLAPGKAILRLNNGEFNAFPVEVNIDPVAVFNAVQDTTTGAYIYSAQPAYQGEPLTATLSNFAPAGSNIPLSSVQVGLDGVMYPATQVTQIGSVWQVGFQVGANAPTGQAEVLVVFLNGQGSVPAIIQVAKPDGTF